MPVGNVRPKSAPPAELLSDRAVARGLDALHRSSVAVVDAESGVRLRSRRGAGGGSSSLGDDEASRSCAICFERADEEADDGAGRTACGHLFHRECLRRWLEECKAGKQTPSCAVCRQPLDQRLGVPWQQTGRSRWSPGRRDLDLVGCRCQ